LAEEGLSGIGLAAGDSGGDSSEGALTLAVFLDDGGGGGGVGTSVCNGTAVSPVDKLSSGSGSVSVEVETVGDGGSGGCGPRPEVDLGPPAAALSCGGGGEELCGGAERILEESPNLGARNT